MLIKTKMINRVLLYNSGGGLGDSIQVFQLIETLKSELTNAKFYYLSAHKNHFISSLKDFNIEIETLNLEVKYFGFRWWHLLVVKKIIKRKKIDSFDLIIDLQTKIRNSLILKMIPHKFFISPCINFKLSNPKIKIKKESKVAYSILSAVNFLFKEKIELKEFNINKINKKFFDESKKLLPNSNYVGFSITQGNLYRKKMWPLNNIINVCNQLYKNNKTPVFFIEKKNIYLKNKISKLIPVALFPEHETNLLSPALVTCLGKRLDLVITIDNGVMHMLSLSKVPMISLFGPTNSTKFAPDYKESIVLDSKKLYKTKDVSAISVEDVLQATKQFLNFSY